MLSGDAVVVSASIGIASEDVVSLVPAAAEVVAEEEDA